MNKYVIFNHQLGETVTIETNQPINLDHLAMAFNLGPEYENSTRELREKVITTSYRNGSITGHYH